MDAFVVAPVVMLTFLDNMSYMLARFQDKQRNQTNVVLNLVKEGLIKTFHTRTKWEEHHIRSNQWFKIIADLVELHYHGSDCKYCISFT